MLRKVLSILVPMLLAACGAGGGSEGTTPFGGGTGDGGTGGGGGTSVTYSIALAMSSQTVTAAQPATVTAKVTDSTGASVVSQVVSFTTGGLGQLSSASALTDATGVATVILSPAQGSTSGADTLTASVTIGSATATKTLGFQLTATNVSIASFTSAVTTLSAYGQTLLTVQLAGGTASAPATVNITSACVTTGRATLTPASVTTSTGTATFTFRDGGCGAFNATDGLQASVAGTSATAALQLALTSPQATSVAFVSATPEEIFLKGSGFVENSNIVFQVRDANGRGVPNRQVLLEPTTLAGGILFDGGAVPVTKQTDSEGNVIVRINSGTVPTPVRVRATLVGVTPAVSTVSSSLAIAVGLPSQQNFSLAQGTHNIEGYERDGVPNTYTVIASDRLGNPVPAGTAINFIAEGGQVQAIRQTTTANGLAQAVANFQTSSPRPADGRVTVLAYALGEESFLDTNGNNVFDTGEDFQDLGDIFLDRLFNGTFSTVDDQFVSLSIAGTDPCTTATSPLLQLGFDSPSRTRTQAGATLNTCVTGWGRAYVRKAIQTVFSTSSGRAIWVTPPGNATRPAGQTSCPTTSLIRPIGEAPYASDNTALTGTYYLAQSPVVLNNAGQAGAFSFIVADGNPVALNPMAAGSTISASGTNGLTVSVAGSPVPSTQSPSSATLTFSFNDTTNTGTVTITFGSPGGARNAVTLVVNRNAETGLSPC
jgi:hypothetical protein